MTITTVADGSTLTMTLEGRLDTTTAPKLEDELEEKLTPSVEELELDFGKLVYISSAGLRVVLAAQKQMNRQGSMKLRNVNGDVMEVFEITGFTDILTIE